MIDDPEHRLDQLSAAPREMRSTRGYTRFVKTLRVVLPLSAAALIVVVMTWPDMEERLPPPPKASIVPETQMGQNELINPRFESTDKDQQPFTVTADKATQSQDNPELVNLTNPQADMKMKDGAWVAAKSKAATYEQSAEKLFLTGDVNLFHDSGYSLETQELRVDMKAQQALTDLDVSIQGPDGTLNAAGMDAQNNAEVVIFKGPAKLVLYSKDGGFSLGKAMP